MIGWILIAIALGLFVLGLLREPFEATQSIKAPPYDAAEKRRIFNMARQRSATPPYSFLGQQDILIDKAKAQAPTETDRNKLEELAGGLLTPAVESFFTTVFKPATTPITKEQVKTFVDARSSDMKPIEQEVLTTYFVGQSGAGTSGYSAALADLGQNAGYLVSNRATTPTAGGAAASVPAGAVAGAAASVPAGGVGSDTTGSAAGVPAGGAAGSNTTGGAAGPTAGGTTGGSSTSAPAPNAGGGGSGKQLFGPTFTSLGAPVSGGATGGDSTQNNQYPELLGGMGDTSVRGPSGVRSPSQNWLLSMSGALPSTASLGSDANSGYLPYSRTPGDQDLIPDPYRMSRNYSAASYSSKTEPVPFLTDFSAFSK